MRRLKRGLMVTAKALRGMSFMIRHWVWVVVILSVVSPISPHLRMPYELSAQSCAFLGTRGVIETGERFCPLVTFVNTRNAELIQMSDVFAETSDMILSSVTEDMSW